MKAERKIRIFILSISLVSVTFWAGCTARQEKAGVVKLRFAYWGIAEEKAITEKVVKLFNQSHPDIEVKFEHIALNYLQKILVQFAGNSAPDIFGVDSTMTSHFAQKGVLINLESYLQEDKEINIDDYYPQVIEVFRYKGDLYALPHEFSTIVLFYNQDLFDEAGVPYPDGTWDWKTFLSAAQELTKRDISGRAKQFGFVFQIVLPILIYQNSGRFYSKDYSKCTFNTSETIEAIKFYIDLFRKHHVSPAPEETALDCFTAFPVGKAAMYYAGRWTVPELRKGKKIRWNIAPLPKGRERATALCAHAIGISTQCKHPKEAWEFIKFMAGEEGQRENSRLGNLAPSLRKVVESDSFLFDEEHHEEARANRFYIESLPYAKLAWGWPINPNIAYDVASRAIDDEIEKVIVGLQTVEEAAKIIEEKINNLLEQ